MPNPPAWTALAFVAILAAGCAAPAGPGTETDATPRDAPDVHLGLTGCLVYHTFFSAPAQAFAGEVPDNFTLDTGAAGTAQVAVYAFGCAGEHAELWALLRVIPPPSHQNASVAVDAVVLRAFTTNATHAQQFSAWGVDPSRVVLSNVREHEDYAAGVARDGRFALGNGTVRYEVRATVQGGGGTFEPTVYRYWTTEGTKATGYLRVATNASQDLGSGTATFRSDGDPGAPPLAVGVGHRIQDAGVDVTHVRAKA